MEDESVKQIMVQVQFQDFDPGFKETTLITTEIPRLIKLEENESVTMDKICD